VHTPRTITQPNVYLTAHPHRRPRHPPRQHRAHRDPPARYDTGVLLRYGTDGTLKNTANPDAASTTAPTDVADIKTSSTGDVYVTKAYDTYKLESDLTLDWRHTHNDGNLAPIALHE